MNDAEIEATTDETEHIFKRISASPANEYERTLELLTHWFEQTIRPLSEEE